MLKRLILDLIKIISDDLIISQHDGLSPIMKAQGFNVITNFKKKWSRFTDTDAVITHRLYKESGISYVIGLLLAVLLIAGSRQTGSLSVGAYFWLGIITLTYVARASLTIHYFRHDSPDLHWLNRFRFGAIFTGLVWSVACFLLFQSNNLLNQSIILFTLTGLCAGATLSYAIDLISLFGFVFLVALGLLTRLFMEKTPTAFAMSCMILLFMLFIVVSARKAHRTIHENLRLASIASLKEKREKSYAYVMEMITNAAPLDTILNYIVNSVERLNPPALCSILQLDSQGKRLEHIIAPSLADFYNRAIDGLAIGPNVGSCGASSYTGMRMIVEDIQTHPNWALYKELASRAELAACWSEPIKNTSGKVLGAFAMYHRKPTSPTNDDLETLTHNAHLAGIAIERANSNQEQLLASMFYQSTSEAMVITDAQTLIVGVNPAFTSMTGYAADEAIGRNPNMLSSGRQDKAFYEEMWYQLNTTGKWQGEIWNRKKNGEFYLEWVRINTIYDQDSTVLNRVSLATDITKKKESEDIIWRQANFDPLTNLPNRRMFNDRLNQEIKKTHRADLPLALMFIDLDHFKEVNDTLGHLMGDVLLIETARRLVSCVRDSDTVSHMDTVSRLGGDEFTIVLGELRDTHCVERVAQRILDKLAEPYQLGSEVVYISASIGITIYPTDSTNADTLIKNADQAMYAAKRLGRNRFSYFTESMQVNVQNRMRLATDLRSALSKKQLFLLYQPIVNLATQKIDKAEALIRWQHPTNGLISPAEFIPIAEDTGLIVDIGDWVFLEAANRTAQWRKSIHPNFQISINKSPVQFYKASSSKSGHLNWSAHLKQLGLPGQSIAVEITERLLLDSNNTIRDQLLEFRDAGIQVSLDDFGTGYSSLSYIKKFDIDYIKIDQSFIRNLESQSDDMAVCEAIIVMAHKLNMKVVAEGVETQQQCDLLKAAGCDYAQGYLFSKPLPVEEFEQLLS